MFKFFCYSLIVFHMYAPLLFQHDRLFIIVIIWGRMVQ